MPDENKIQPSERYSAAQCRVLAAALELFCKHGVAGTSLQMIAAQMGVTKAAVYHQFPSKDDIVEAIGESFAEKLSWKADLAEQKSNDNEIRKAFIEAMILLAVHNRKFAHFAQNDPIMLRYIREHKTYRNITQRINALLLNGATSAHARTAVSMLLTGIGGAVLNPLVSDIPEQELFDHMMDVAMKLVALVDE